MTYVPTPEQVATAWVKTVPGVDATKVATSLPADDAGWATSGFWTVTVFPGAVDLHVPLFSPVVRVDCWAVNLGSTKPPWGRAGSGASAIQWATYGTAGCRPSQPSLAADFHPVRVLQVNSLGSPVRVRLDDAGYARVQVDVQLFYTLAVAP